MSDQSGQWQWSQDYQQYYRDVYDPNRRVWDRFWQHATSKSGSHGRIDSIVEPAPSFYADPTSAGAAQSPAYSSQPPVSPYSASAPTPQYSVLASYPTNDRKSYYQQPTGHSPNVSPHGHNTSPSYFTNIRIDPEQTPRPSYAIPDQRPHASLPSQYPHQQYANTPPIQEPAVTNSYPNTVSTHVDVPSRGQGLTVQGSYHPDRSPNPTEELDASYHVRDRQFFREGKMFSVLFTEPAGETANPTAYNDSFSTVKYGGRVHTQIRRFISVRCRREFCFACPVFTYGGKATLKRGVYPNEHAIAYSDGSAPTLLRGESGLKSKPICIVNLEGLPPLNQASRIYFGIHHPIQYNVKVKDLGDVHPQSIRYLRGYFNEEERRQGGTMQDIAVTNDQGDEDEDDDDDEI